MLTQRGLTHIMVGTLTDVVESEYDILDISLAVPWLSLDKLSDCTISSCKALYQWCEVGCLHQVVKYKSGDSAIVQFGGQECVVVIRRFFLVTFVERSINIVEVDKYKKIAIKTVIDTAIVQPSGSHVCLPVSTLKRKVLLMPELESAMDPHHHLVIDYLRRFPLRRSTDVIVPYFPQVNDMVLIQGSDPQPWKGRVLDFDSVQRILSVVFYVEHASEHGTFVRESRHVDRAHVNSVVGIAEGSWIGTSYLAWSELAE